MHLSTQTYQHSGQLGIGIVLSPLFGLVGGVVGSMIYAYLTVYSPIVGVVSALAVIGLSIGVGWIVSKGGRIGHLRNSVAVHAVGFVVGVFTLYCAWVFFEWVLIRRSGEAMGVAELLGLFLSPAAVWQVAVEIGSSGWYSIGSSDTPLSGIPLWITWILEALIIVGGVTFAAGFLVDDEVYCEHRHAWVPQWSDPVRLRFPQSPDQLMGIEQADLDQLEAFAAASDNEAPRLDVQVWAAEDDRRTAAYRVQLFTAKLDKQGKVQTETKNLSPKLLASESDLDRLAALAAREPEPLPDAPATDEAGEEAAV